MDKETIIETTPNWWKELITQWIEELTTEWFDINNINYIKEKYWRLRIESILHNDILSELEVASWYICEVCWNSWRTRYDLPWYKTLCDKHYIIKKEEYGIKTNSI